MIDTKTTFLSVLVRVNGMRPCFHQTLIILSTASVLKDRVNGWRRHADPLSCVIQSNGVYRPTQATIARCVARHECVDWEVVANVYTRVRADCDVTHCLLTCIGSR